MPQAANPAARSGAGTTPTGSPRHARHRQVALGIALWVRRAGGVVPQLNAVHKFSAT